MTYKLRTIDIWDTLLRRDCHPECIKLSTAIHLLLGYPCQIKTGFHNHWALYRVRIDVERKLAEISRCEDRDDEYEIIDVFRNWLSIVLSEPVSVDLPVMLAEFELQVEIKRSFPDPQIKAVLDGCQAEISHFLSDFYMSGGMLGRLLEAKGLRHLATDIFSSCDIGLNKRSGKIFRHIHMLHGVAPERHVHIGDNHWSDFESAKKEGVNAICYLPKSLHEERLERERLFPDRKVLFDHVFQVSSDMAFRITREMTVNRSTAFRAGNNAASIFIGFILWIAEITTKNRIERLFFFTGEGEFFYKIFVKLFPDLEIFGYKLPPCQVLSVSDLSTFTPSMKLASPGDMLRTWSLFKNQSASEVFCILGIDIERFSGLLKKYHLNVNDNIVNFKESQFFKALLHDPLFIDALNKSIKCQKYLLCRYLEKSGFDDCKNIGMVGFGYLGTTQDNLALVCPEINFHGMYLGLRQFINIQQGNVTKSAYGPDENNCSNTSHLFEVFSDLERLCFSGTGSVCGYQQVAGEIMPIRLDNSCESYNWFIEEFQRGVIMAADVWQPYIERYVVSSKELLEPGLKNLVDFRENDLGKYSPGSRDHDLLGIDEIFIRNNIPSLATIVLSPVMRKKRIKLIGFIRGVQSVSEIKNFSGVGKFNHWLLVLMFRVVHIIKSSRLGSR